MKGAELAAELLFNLKGKKYFICGNHDSFVQHSDFDKSLFASILDYLELEYANTKFVLFHYPMLEWNGFFRDSIALHGHQHNHEDYNYENLKNGILRYDVGVDANYMAPVSAEDIIAFFQLQEL